MKRHVASKHDSRDLIEKIQAAYGVQLETSRSSQVEIIEPEDGVKFVVIDGRFTFVEMGAPDAPSLIPFVGSAAAVDLFPSARVDDGAIKYIIKGADVMRPGIVKYDEWGAKDRLVVVRDDSKGRALAVGRTAVESAELSSMARGNCIRNLHHAGDRIWEAHKKI